MPEIKYWDLKAKIKSFSPNDILSEVASLLSQNDTHDMTTNRMHGPYTWLVILKNGSKVCKSNLDNKISHVTL